MLIRKNIFQCRYKNIWFQYKLFNRKILQKQYLKQSLLQRIRFPLVYSVDPTSPSLQSQHPHFRQSSCQNISRALSKYRSWIFFPHPAHSCGPPDVFWVSALTPLIVIMLKEKKHFHQICNILHNRHTFFQSYSTYKNRNNCNLSNVCWEPFDVKKCINFSAISSFE